MIVIKIQTEKINQVFSGVKDLVGKCHSKVENLPQSTKVVLLVLVTVLCFNVNATRVEITKQENIYPKIQETLNSEVPEKEEVEEKVEKESFIGINTNFILPMIKVKKEIAITDIITDSRVIDFITHNEILKRAYNVQKKTGLSTCTIIAQKGLESNWGKSSLCALTKNLGNIKCFNKNCQKYNVRLNKRGQKGSVTSHCVQLYDDSWKDRYIRFNTYQEGWNSYCSLIERIYQNAAKSKTFQGECKNLKKRGYATDKNYDSKLIGLIHSTNLDKLQKYIDEGYVITSKNGKYIFLE